MPFSRHSRQYHDANRCAAGCLGDIVVGIVGAFVGGLVFNFLGMGGSSLNNSNFSLGGLLVAFYWSHVHLRRRFRGATHDITIRRGTGEQPGCSVNGEGWQAEFLPIAAAGTTQHMEIVV